MRFSGLVIVMCATRFKAAYHAMRIGLTTVGDIRFQEDLDQSMTLFPNALQLPVDKVIKILRKIGYQC